METRDLLARCAKLINKYGPNAPEVDAFIAEHRQNQEFVDLAELSRDLKRALTINPVKPPVPQP